MSLLRTIGYIGIALLLLIAALGAYVAVTDRDWMGALLMLTFLGLMAFLFRMLRLAARRESDTALRAKSDLGWYGASLSAFFQGPVLHTVEGLIVLVGGGLSLLFAVMGWLAPAWLFLHPAKSSGQIVLFAMWPLILFVYFVKFCGPHFRSGTYNRVALLVIAGIPFYAAYK